MSNPLQEKLQLQRTFGQHQQENDLFYNLRDRGQPAAQAPQHPG